MKNAIARRYAQAFFRLVRQEDLTAAQDGLHALSSALKDSPAFKHVLASPVFTLDEKLQVLTTLCERTGCPPIMGRFCEQLLKEKPDRVPAGDCRGLQSVDDPAERQATDRRGLGSTG